MKTTGNTVLVTGGTAGIGYALAKRFLNAGNTVIICGRRENLLIEAQLRAPGLHIRVCDVSQKEERIALADWLAHDFPQLNVLVNNAAIQQEANLMTTTWDWDMFQREIDTNLAAPIHLSVLLGRKIAALPNPTIVNISSGLAFIPKAAVPVYCATKAALHSFCINLRTQLKAAGVEVVEIAPPAVNTDLGGHGKHTYGVSLNEFVDSVMIDLAAGKREIGYEATANVFRLSPDAIDTIMAKHNELQIVPL